MNDDPREVIGQSRMSTLQIVAVALMIGLNGLDGFDVLSISFASNGIFAEFGLRDSILGILLAMELVGMAIGSIFLGDVADRIGRRKTILTCLVVMAVGMYMVTLSGGIYSIAFWRIVTGIGIGGMLSSITAATAEFSNFKRRALCVMIMSIGYPIGAFIGGYYVAPNLTPDTWRFVFWYGAVATLAFIPLVYFLIPESVHWLARKQPAGALERINATLKRMGHATVAALPQLKREEHGATFKDIFGPALLVSTVIVTIAYFLHIMSFYFVIKWVPRIVSEMGFSDAQAGGVLNWVNAGGATGGAILGLLAIRYRAKGLTIAVLVLSAVAVFVFGGTGRELMDAEAATQQGLLRLSWVCLACGFCINAAIVGLYALFTEVFPTQVRAFGTGFAIGMGRGGSILAPIIAGFLFEAGLSVQTVAFIMGTGPLLAGAILIFLKLKPAGGEPVAVDQAPGAALPGAAATGTAHNA